ncbi:hypothetical protein B0H63DRAFT_540864 [Podospora didyma]|uniref:RTA1 domain protein n=1 Tax=Podospora didyma TaxID=330526 RepID=A0AAE0NSR3_9PEZI|nr:hypothetical protein B0H63DRAFT_540864 [Podospora didyma]
MSDGSLAQGSVYLYVPNKGAAIFFTAAFASSGLFHLWQCFYYQCFKTTALLPFCCALLTAGFATRAYGAVHYDDAQVYTASTLLIYLSPHLANFQILGRVFHFVPYFASMHPARMLLTFACLTAVTELLTAMGVSYLANRALPEKLSRMGDSMMKASLIVQILIVSLFFLMAGIFHYCCRASGIGSPKVMRPMAVLCTSMALVLGRTLYRVAEHFSTAPNPSALDPSSLSPVVLNEWYFYVFDAALMLIGLVLWNVWHPRRYLPQSQTRYLAQDGVTVLKGPGWKDSRSLAETFLDPFAAMTNRGGHKKPFWEHNGYALKRRR